MAEDSQNLLTTKVGTGARLLERYSRLPCAGMGLALLSGMIFATGSFIVTLVTAINPFEIVMIR